MSLARPWCFLKSTTAESESQSDSNLTQAPILQLESTTPNSESGADSYITKYRAVKLYGKAGSATDRETATCTVFRFAHAKTNKADYETDRKTATCTVYRFAHAKTNKAEYETEQDSQFAVFKFVVADTELADYGTERDSQLTVYKFAVADTETADHATKRNAAGFEANKHAFLSGHESTHETTRDGIALTTAEQIAAAHDGGASSRVDGAAMGTGQAITDILAELHFVTTCHAGMSKTTAKRFYSVGQSKTDDVAGLFTWLAPVMVDGALYIRHVYENPDDPDTENTIHIT